MLGFVVNIFYDVYHMYTCILMYREEGPRTTGIAYLFLFKKGRQVMACHLNIIDYIVL